MPSKISYHIHNRMHHLRQYSAAEKQYLLDHLKRLQPTTLLVLDDDDWARELKAALPNCAVVIRFHDEKEGEFHLPPDNSRLSPESFFARYSPRAHGGLIVNLLNEPNGYDENKPESSALEPLAKWVAKAMDLFGNAGIPVVAPNFGEGHPDVDKLDRLDVMWDAFKKWHGLHYYGIHEYGTHRGMLFNEGGRFDVYPWRVGRFERFTVPYLVGRGQPIPRVIVTESGIDSAHDDTGKRGWRDAFTEAQYFNQLMSALQEVYCAAHYVGVCLYCWGNTGQDYTPTDWRSFDVSEAKELHRKLEDHAQQQKPSGKPENVSVPLKILLSNPTALHADANETSLTLQGLPKGSIGVMYDIPAIPDATNRIWKWFQPEGAQAGGFILASGLQFRMWTPEPEPPPVEPPPVVTLPQTYAITLRIEGAVADKAYLDWIAQLAAITIRSRWNIVAVENQIPAGEHPLAPLNVELII